MKEMSKKRTHHPSDNRFEKPRAEELAGYVQSLRALVDGLDDVANTMKKAGIEELPTIDGATKARRAILLLQEYIVARENAYSKVKWIG